MSDFENLIEEIEKLSLPEVAELVKTLEERWGVSAAAPVAVAAVAGAVDGGAAAAEEQTEFSVMLEDVGPEKIKVIKAVREVNPGLGLREAKEVVESAPAAIIEGLTKEDAEAAQKTLAEAGAKVALK
ncbi:MAG: 50S ribosomal protein L7/L12 [Anaerolineae bacterium]